jgi:hypothetical protein
MKKLSTSMTREKIQAYTILLLLILVALFCFIFISEPLFEKINNDAEYAVCINAREDLDVGDWACINIIGKIKYGNCAREYKGDAGYETTCGSFHITELNYYE